MEAGSRHAGGSLGAAGPCLALAPRPPPEPCAPAELRALVHGGQTDSDAAETLLAQVARVEGALELEIGDGLAALGLGDRLIRLGFSSLRDYAREVLGIGERAAQAMARLSRGLRSRPLLRAAVRAGEVRPRSAQTVLPVAVGEAEAEWVERARVETVRALERAVRAARAGGEEEEEWTRLRVRLSPEDRATVDEALAIAGGVMPGSTRPQRLGLSPRAVEQRAALERRLWQVPALRAARDGGLSYEKVRLLARLPDREIEGWLPRARVLTCVALGAALEDRDEAQMRAARVLRARVPVRTALLLQDAFRAVRAAEGRLLDDGRCLVCLARHFGDIWRPHAKKARTLSQKVRERDLGRCQVPGCSRRAVHAHHVERRSRGGLDVAENLVALCACHHLRGIHGGYIRVWGRAPDALVWEVGGAVWAEGRFGGAVVDARAA